MTQSKQKRGAKGDIFIQSRRLVARSSPETDESLYGWAVRLADANGYANAKAILSLAAAESSQDPLRDRLAHLVDGSPNDFGKYVARRASAGPCHCLEMDLGLLYFDKRPKICPSCLADRAILKSVWNLRNWAYCPQHLCKLIEECPFCHHTLRRGQHSVTHCGNRFCTGDLSTCSADPVPRDITNIVVMLGDVASGQRGRSFREPPEGLNNTSLRDLIYLIDTLSKPLLRDDIRLEDTAFNRLKITEDVLTAWPHGYRRYLDQLRSLPFDAIPRMSLLDREFHYLLRALKYRQSPIMGAMKYELANYIEEHIPQATEARFTLTGTRSGRVTLQRVIREQRLSPTAVRRAQRKGLIQTIIPPQQSKMGTRYVVEHDHILTHIRDTDILTPRPTMRAKYNLASVEESAKFLRVKTCTVESLSTAGYIETLSNHGTTWCKYSSINDLLAKLANVAIHGPSDDSHQWSELNRARSVSAAELTDVVECALSGKLQIRVRGGTGRGLRCFLFKRKDLVRLFPVVPRGYVTVSEASQYPHWTKEYLCAAIQSGLLASAAHPRGGRMIEATALAAFRAEYINSNELEELYGIGRFRISQALIGSGALTNSVYPRIYRRGPALALQLSFFEVGTLSGGLVSSAPE
jgi:hypothetical protein